MSFYKTSLMIMVVVLIICLAVLGVAISNSEESKLYPPTLSDCPDYYVKDDTGVCVDLQGNLSSVIECHNIDTNSFNQNEGTGEASNLCQKKRWAEDCGVNWDGITNNENICYT